MLHSSLMFEPIGPHETIRPSFLPRTEAQSRRPPRRGLKWKLGLLLTIQALFVLSVISAIAVGQVETAEGQPRPQNQAMRYAPDIAEAGCLKSENCEG